MSRGTVAEEIVLFCFSFQKFSNFERILSDFWPKASRNRQNYLLCVQTNSFWLEETFKSFDFFWIFCRNLRHGSQYSIYVSRVKIAEENFFLFFLSEFFRILSEKVFRLLAKKLQEFVKTTFYVSRGTVAEEIVFFVFLFRSFRILSEYYQTFGQKTSRNRQNYLLCVQTNSFWLEETFKSFDFFLDFLQKPSAWFSKFYLRVQSKNCIKNIFLIFLFSLFFEFWTKNFSDFRPKNFKKLSKLPSACPEEHFVTLFFLKVLNRSGFSAETFGMVLKILSTCPE